MKDIRQRAITGVLLILGATFGLGVNVYTFLIFFGIVCSLCLWEFLTIILPEEVTKEFVTHRIIGVILGLMPFILVGLHRVVPDVMTWNWIGRISTVVIFGLFIVELFLKTQQPFQYLSAVLMGLIYLGVPFALVILVEAEYTTAPIIGMWMFIAAFDVAAYLVGSQIGKTPLFPRISPKKSWEGIGGGVALLLIILFALPYLFAVIESWFGIAMPIELTNNDWFVIAGIALVFGTLGDLIESMLKRSFKIKDSGTLLPGHGGFLDRFDSFYFPLPFMAMYLLF